MDTKHANSGCLVYSHKAADELEHSDGSGIDLSGNLANLSITESPRFVPREPRFFASEGM